MAPRVLRSPLIVGRDQHLELAERHLAEAAAGRGSAILIAGVAGIGKSRLIGAIMRKATAAGFRLAGGDLAPQDRHVPLASVLDLARTMQTVRTFGTLGDELLVVERIAGGDSLGARRLLVRRVAGMILDAIDRPTVLKFDDLQWADELSLEVIGELARLGRDRPLLLIAAYRQDELPAGSLHREWRARLRSQRLAEELRLDPLTRDETALVVTLIAGTGLPAPREVVNAVFERTDGIPLHVEELLAALDEASLSSGRAIRRAHVPESIGDAVLARYGRLSEDARVVARAGSVMGRCFVPDALAGCLDRPAADLDAPLAELVDQGFLYPFAFLDRGYYDFRHQLLRDALYDTVPPAELRRLHARAAEFGALMDGSNDVHASVHYERAGMRTQAYRAALAGAQAAAAISSRREAYELYRRAVANVPDGLGPAELAALYEGYLGAALDVDDIAVANDVSPLVRAHHLEAGMALEAAMDLVTMAATARRDLVDVETKRRLILQAQDELMALEPSPDRHAGESEVHETLGAIELNAGRLDGAEARFREARRLILASSTPDTTSVDYLLAEVAVLRGDVRPALGRMLDLAREARAERRETVGVGAYRWAAVSAVRMMEHDTAHHAVEEGLRYAAEIEQSYCRHSLAVGVRPARLGRGALGRCRGDRPDRGGGARQRARPARVAGLAGARGHGAGRGRRRSGAARAVAGCAACLGRGGPVPEHAVGARRDRPGRGRARGGVRALRGGRRPGGRTRPAAVPRPVRGHRCRAAVAARRPADAERWVERLAERLEGWEAMARPALDHATGLVRLAAGSTGAARSALAAAVTGWDARGRVWEATWARLELATCLVRMNRHADAVPLVRDVEATADRLGSVPLRDRARTLLSRARSRAIEDEPWRPLTVRELEVARLVARGWTNNEIAEELSVAPRTVNAHLEHILGKLGVGRRAEVAAVGVRHRRRRRARGRAPPRRRSRPTVGRG